LVVNCGDSRAVLSRAGEAIALSSDHKPNSASERERITKLGGSVKWHGLTTKKSGKPILGTGVWRVNGNLAVSRAIGDVAERPFVSPTPETHRVTGRRGDEFVIVATDGLWDAFSSQEAVNFVQRCLRSVASKNKGVGKKWQGKSKAKGTSRNNNGNDDGDDKSEKGEEEEEEEALLEMKKKMASLLTSEAIRRGASDNVTVVLLWIK